VPILLAIVYLYISVLEIVRQGNACVMGILMAYHGDLIKLHIICHCLELLLKGMHVIAWNSLSKNW
jgi:hypothetical protein